MIIDYEMKCKKYSSLRPTLQGKSLHTAHNQYQVDK